MIWSNDVLESLYKFRIREFEQLKTVLELYEMEIHENINAQLSKVEDNQKFRLRNFDARHGKIESGAVIKSRKGLSGIEGGEEKVYVTSGKK